MRLDLLIHKNIYPNYFHEMNSPVNILDYNIIIIFLVIVLLVEIMTARVEKMTSSSYFFGCTLLYNIYQTLFVNSKPLYKLKLSYEKDCYFYFNFSDIGA